MDCGRIIDRDDVGPGVDGKHQLGAAEHHRLNLLPGKLDDQSLELALAVADHAAGGELFEDDPVNLAARLETLWTTPRSSRRT
jgi:hypothetical protein